MVLHPTPKDPYEGPYKDIADYGIIGDLSTVALVGLDGSIDWYCYPRIDSPSVFGALLDHTKGGRFRIHADAEGHARQIYLPDTNVLVTRFLTDRGVAEVIDYMPLAKARDARGPHRIVRRVTCVRGQVPFRLECRPAFNYARDDHALDLRQGGAVFRHDEDLLALCSPVPVRGDGEGGVTAEFEVEEGDTLDFGFQAIKEPGECDAGVLDRDTADRLFEGTVEYWRDWAAQSNYTGRWRSVVTRSALALKLLICEQTGAVVAAATTSLPEAVGGNRNWDYRNVWLRDAAFTMYALLRIGFSGEAGHFMRWLHDRILEHGDRSLQPVYTVDGDPEIPERTLDHLEGYRGSRPVRIGNRASEQLQLDFYGAILDAAYLYNKHGQHISYQLWLELRRVLDWVCDNWHRPDKGIWEMRAHPMHHTFSKMMCWVALDRGLRLAAKRSFPAPVERWRDQRDAIYEQVMEKGWDPERGTFVHAYSSRTVDAANLLMPLVFFVSPTDARILGTLQAIREDLGHDNLVHRYDADKVDDGLEGEEGTFNLCSFWLVEALTRAGRLHEARLLFEKMLGYANHLWLYSEETGKRGEALGNFPQAFTHLALISAAFNLDRALDAAGQ